MGSKSQNSGEVDLWSLQRLVTFLQGSICLKTWVDSLLREVQWGDQILGPQATQCKLKQEIDDS